MANRYRGNALSDAHRLALKYDHEDQERLLKEHQKNDIPEFPSWTFLLPEVIDAYGVCPYLDVRDDETKDMRVVWLRQQKDKGATYERVKSDALTEKCLRAIEKSIEEAKEALTTYVKSRCSTQGTSLHDNLLERIQERKAVKNQNERAKTAWKETVNHMNNVMTETGIDFAKYVRALLSVTVKYTPPKTVALDPHFKELLEKHAALHRKYTNTVSKRQQEIQEARGRLAALIRNDYSLNQTGKYFKKLSTLSEEKRDERIRSYCEWHMQKHHHPHGHSILMYDFIRAKLSRHELRLTDITWDNDLGIITNIDLVEVKAVVGSGPEFALAERDVSNLRPRKISRKMREEQFRNEAKYEFLQRVNRLLLREILKGHALVKDKIIRSVISDLHVRGAMEADISNYLVRRYEDLVKAIENQIN